MNCTLVWSEIKLMLKSKISQVDYGSMIISEQLLSEVVGHRMFLFFAKLASKIRHLYIFKMARKVTKL